MSMAEIVNKIFQILRLLIFITILNELKNEHHAANYHQP
jgi:hypothetical protein